MLESLVEDHLKFSASCARVFDDPNLLRTAKDEAAYVAAQLLIRENVMRGALDDAVAICEKICPEVLTDQQIQLSIRIHKLVELIHLAETTFNEASSNDSTNPSKECKSLAISKAVQHSQSLAEFALNAFPDAYDEFTESMLLFVDTDKVINSSFILGRRQSVSQTLVAQVRRATRAYGSKLSMLLRYLISVYIQYRTPFITRDECPPPLHVILQNILNYSLPENVTAAPLQWNSETSVPMNRFEAPTAFEEADVQALPERVGISRQRAIDALRAANGDVFNALCDELCSISISAPVLHKLIIDFAAARNLDSLDVIASDDTQMMCQESRHGDAVPKLSNDGKRIAVFEQNLTGGICEMARAMRDVKKASVLQANDMDVSLDELRQAIQRAGAFDEDIVKFRVAQRETAILAEKLQFEAALDVVRSKMSVIVQGNPSLQDDFEETAMIIVCTNGGGPEETRDNSAKMDISETSVAEVRSHVLNKCSIAKIVDEVYGVLERRYGEPDLVMVVRGLLETHAEWQITNMFTDRYSERFGVDALRHNSTREQGVGSGSPDEANIPKDNNGSTTVRNSGSSDNERMEESILLLMEVLAMSRAEAISIIQSHARTASPQMILESMLH